MLTTRPPPPAVVTPVPKRAACRARLAALVPLAVASGLLRAVGAPGCSAQAQAFSADGGRDELVVYESYELPNGLSVILSHDTRAPRVAVSLWYHAGVRHEPAGQAGLTQLVQHAMFAGSAHVGSAEHRARLARAGATEVGAETGIDHTSYHENVPANYLETALWLESDRMGFLLSTLSAAKIERLRQLADRPGTSRVERAFYGDSPDGEAWLQLMPAPHPSLPVLSPPTAQPPLSLADVQRFFAWYYVPGNATLTLAGDFDPVWVKKVIAKYFGALTALPPPALAEPRPGPEIHELASLGPEELPLVRWQWPSPAALTAGDAAAHVLAKLLTGGGAGLLDQSWLFEAGHAQSIEARQHSAGLYSLFSLEALGGPGVSEAQLEHAVGKSLAELCAHGVGAAAVARARSLVKSELLASLQTLSGVAERLQYYAQYAHDPGYWPRDMARYDAVQPRDVERLANQMLCAGPPVKARRAPVKAAKRHAGAAP